MFLVVLGIGLVWLNGPGLRYIAPKVVAHFLQKAGIRGDVKIGGSLIGGLSFSDLSIETDGALAKLTIDQVTPDYQWRGLIKGKLEGLTVDGVHADLRLGIKKKDEEKPPLDLKKLVETIRSVRGRVLPLNLDLKNISLTATRDGKTELQLAPSRLFHKPGSKDIQLALGAFTDAAGRVWEARQSTIVWNTDDLAIARLDPFPGVSLREFVMQLPAGGEPSVESQVHLDDAVFVLTSTPGFTSANIDLREGKLQVDETVKHFGIGIPAKASLVSLAIEVNGILPDPKGATGSVRISLDDVAFQDWTMPELSLDAQLGTDLATVVSHGVMLGTPFSLDVAAPVRRQETRFTLGDAKGTFNIADVPKALRELAPRVPAIDPEAPVPLSSVEGNFTVAFLDNKPQSADADLLLKPQDPTLASPVSLKGRWAPDAPVTANLIIDGLKAAVSYQIEPATYQGTLELDEFTNTRIDRWLFIVKVKPGGVANLSGKWRGGGGIKTGKHQGEFSFTQATWTREDAAPVTGIGGAKYDWPEGFETQGLRVQMNDQTVALDAALANGLLELRKFVWNDAKTELASGTASLPVPEDFSKWRETLAKDARPVSVAINSRVLSLGLLKPWVPALEKLDPRSTGQLDFNVSGTYSEPVIAAKFEARDLRSPTQPKLPPADLKIELAGKEGKLTLTGSAIAPDFAPAEIKATLPFRPAEWAETPGLIKEETLDARVDLPRLDISRFGSLIPVADKIAGILTGNVVVTGKIGKPEIKGTIDLAAAGLRFKADKFPAVEAGAAKVEFGLDRVELKTLKATIAGGTLQGGGTLAITDGKLGDINLRIQGNHLPLMRNDLLILRANADLRLQGPWERAALSGTVGAVDSIFYRDIELLPIGKPFTGPSAAALPRIDPPQSQAAALPAPFGSWGLNVTVRTEEPFLIRGNLATGEVNGSMRIGGTLAAPAPDGAFKIKDFRASLPFSTLSVRNGTISFTPASGFDPILEIRGTAEPRPYVVTVYAYGRASNPQLVLTSNPPLPENEIMTLLATGTTTTGLENPQAASSRAMQLLAEEIRRGRFRFGKQLRPLLGLLDRVDFSLSEADPYSSDAFSTATLALSDRWFISAGMGATGDSRFLVIWRLSFR
ncbi:MAG: translocation/assembly module TamB domain-containing protein [Verrucomicrobiota bacterium]